MIYGVLINRSLVLSRRVCWGEGVGGWKLASGKVIFDNLASSWCRQCLMENNQNIDGHWAIVHVLAPDIPFYFCSLDKERF
nr:hypothetical protein Itr_chr12CG20360 [Ipomoea trifida]